MLSIIIAHYTPENNQECEYAFKKNLENIHNQKFDFPIEVIIADDGSVCNNSILEYDTEIITQDDMKIYRMHGNNLENWLKEKNFHFPEISNWLYLPKIKQCMSKARLWNIAVNLAKGDRLFFLDDDNYFISNNSIEKINKLFDKHDIICGQVQDNSGRIRPFSSHRVQGTTFGVKKNILKNVGGFGEWTEAVSSGIDSDIWWKLYQYAMKNKNISVVFTENIRTIDACSKRWKPFISQLFRHKAVAKLFYKIHGCKNYRNVKSNPSRDKTTWMKKIKEIPILKNKQNVYVLTRTHNRSEIHQKSNSTANICDYLR